MEDKRMPTAAYDDVMFVFYNPKYKVYFDEHGQILDIFEILTPNQIYLFRDSHDKNIRTYRGASTYKYDVFGHKSQNIEVRLFWCKDEHYPKNKTQDEYMYCSGNYQDCGCDKCQFAS